MATVTSTHEDTKTYHGGCHCGFIRYAVDLPANVAASKCNCSICLKTNRLSITTSPDKFKLLQPASIDELSDYQFNSKSQHHYFCDKCGVHIFGRGTYVYEGKEVLHMTINAVTLDQGQGIDLRKLKVLYWDGKENNWRAGGKDDPYEGGTY